MRWVVALLVFAMIDGPEASVPVTVATRVESGVFIEVEDDWSNVWAIKVTVVGGSESDVDVLVNEARLDFESGYWAVVAPRATMGDALVQSGPERAP